MIYNIIIIIIIIIIVNRRGNENKTLVPTTIVLQSLLTNQNVTADQLFCVVWCICDFVP